MSMKTASESLKPLTRALRLVFFENWLRFYFLAEEDQQPVFRIPDFRMSQIDEMEPCYRELAAALNGKNMDFATSRTAILNQMAKIVADPASIRSLLCQTECTKELELFQAWLQLHADQLEQNFLTFENWLNLYARWQEVTSQPVAR